MKKQRLPVLRLASCLLLVAGSIGCAGAGSSQSSPVGPSAARLNTDVPDPPPPPPPGGGSQGCTPGYWKQPQHFDSWAAPYTPNTPFSAVFEDAFPGKTLVQVLGLGGGGLNALGRHTVAALLNAGASGVQYGAVPAQIIGAFNDAYDKGSKDYESLKDDLAARNERGCPLD